MVALIHRVGDVAHPGAVADLPDEGGAAPELIYGVPVGPLAHGADHGLAGNQHFLPFPVFADQALFRYPQSLQAGVNRGILVHLLHENRPVPDVAVHCQGVPHLHQMDLLSLHAQMDGAFAACQAAAQHHHGVRHLLLFQVVVVDHHYIVSINSRQGRHNGGRAHRQNQGVRGQLLQQLRRGRRVQANFHALLLHLPGKGQTQLIHLVLKGQGLLGLKNASQLPGFLQQNHLVSPLGCGNGRFHAAHTAAGNHHFFLPGGGQYIGALALPADQGVDGTPPGAGGGPLRHAGKAAQAADNLVLLSRHDLVGQEGVGQQRPGHLHHVRPAGGDDFLHLGRVIQGADGGHRLVNVLLDLRRQIHVVPVRGEHGQVGGKEAELVAARRNVNQIHQILHSLGDLHPVFQGIPSVKQFCTAHPELNGESRANGFADLRQHLPGEPEPIFKAAAVFIGAVVESRRQELVHQPAVAAVNHDHLEPHPLGQGGRLAVGFHNVGNLFFGQGLHRDAVRPHPVAGPELGQAFLLVLVHQIGTGILAGVAQLHAGHRPVPGHSIGQEGPARQISRGGQIDVKHMAGVGLGMYHQLAGGDGGGAALGPKLIETRGPGTNGTVGGDVRAAHRGREHSVAEGHPSQGDGLAQVGKFGFHGAILRLFLISLLF